MIKQKLLYISNSIIPSTTANSVHVMKMCNALSRFDNDVVIIAPKFYSDHAAKIVNAHDYYGVDKFFSIYLGPYPSILFGHTKSVFYSFFCFFKSLKYLSRKSGFFYGRNILSCSLLSLINRKGALEIHSTPDKFAYYERFFFNLALKKKKLKLVVISDALKSLIFEYAYEKNFKISDVNILTLHDAADIPNERGSEFTGEKLLGELNKVKVGYIGHLYPGRGIEIIIESAKMLSDIEFHIVGGTVSDIDYWNRQGVPKNVFFYGHVEPRLTSTYRGAFDILLAPYQSRVSINGKGDTSAYMSPLKIFEYMSSKRPIICSDLPVLREVLNQENSILVKCDVVSEWVEAISKLVDDKKLARLLSDTAYQQFISNYTWSIRARKVMEFVRV